MVDALDAILIIDPDERHRAFARDVLDRAGYDVRATAAEDEAAHLLDRWRPAAVVAPRVPSGGRAPGVATTTTGQLDTTSTLGGAATTTAAGRHRSSRSAASASSAAARTS